MNKKTKGIFAVLTVIYFTIAPFGLTGCKQHTVYAVANDNNNAIEPAKGQVKEDTNSLANPDTPMSTGIYTQETVNIDINRPVEVNLQNNAMEIQLKGQEENDKPIKVRIEKSQELPVSLSSEESVKIEVKGQVKTTVDRPIDVEITNELLEVHVKTSKLKTILDTFNSLADFFKTIVELILSPTPWAMIAAIAAVFALKVARKHIRKLHETTEAQLYAERLKEYGSEEMLDSLKLVYEWPKSREGKRAKEAIEDIEEKEDRDEQKKYLQFYFKLSTKVNVARRRVKMYFSSILQLLQKGYRDPYFLKYICTYDNIVKLGWIITILEKANTYSRGDKIKVEDDELTPFPAIAKLLSKQGIEILGHPKYQTGDEVRITSGPHKGETGKIEKKDVYENKPQKYCYTIKFEDNTQNDFYTYQITKN